MRYDGLGSLKGLPLLLVKESLLLEWKADSYSAEAACKRLKTQVYLLRETIAFAHLNELWNCFALELTIEGNIWVSEVRLCDTAVVERWTLNRRRKADNALRVLELFMRLSIEELEL